MIDICCICCIYWVSLVAQSVESDCNAGDLDSIPGSGRSHGEGNGHPPQHSCLEHPVDRGVWQATVYEVTRVGNDWVTKHTAAYIYCYFKPCFLIDFIFLLVSFSFVFPFMLWWFSFVLGLHSLLFGFYEPIVCFWFVVKGNFFKHIKPFLHLHFLDW